jgi:HEAT repeat protein
MAMRLVNISRVSRMLCILAVVAMGGGREAAGAQEPAAPQPVPAAQLQAAIDKLGDLDYGARTGASRIIRRTPASQAVPPLLRAVAEHRDGYVRYRALVLLTGFNDPRSKDAMRASLGSPNDRLRAVAYTFFEHNPDLSLIPQFLSALDTEQGEFVRPSLVRALAAAADDQRVRPALVREVTRGEDFFRSAVIEAFGDYKARYAYDAVTSIAKLEGPLQDDAALALGKIGDKRALETLAALQRSAPRHVQPSIAAAICLLDINCSSHEHYLSESLKFSDKNIGYQELLRAAAAGLGALAVAGHAEAVDALIEIGIPSRDPTRSPIALALGTIALRNTPLMMTTLEHSAARDGALALLAEGFDMLEEDLDKERFFTLARRTYWDSPEGSPRRALMQTVIGKLDF